MGTPPSASASSRSASPITSRASSRATLRCGAHSRWPRTPHDPPRKVSMASGRALFGKESTASARAAGREICDTQQIDCASTQVASASRYIPLHRHTLSCCILQRRCRDTHMCCYDEDGGVTAHAVVPCHGHGASFPQKTHVDGLACVLCGLLLEYHAQCE